MAPRWMSNVLPCNCSCPKGGFEGVAAPFKGIANTSAALTASFRSMSHWKSHVVCMAAFVPYPLYLRETYHSQVNKEIIVPAKWDALSSAVAHIQHVARAIGAYSVASTIAPEA